MACKAIEMIIIEFPVVMKGYNSNEMFAMELK